jgi:hypothetical protein
LHSGNFVSTFVANLRQFARKLILFIGLYGAENGDDDNSNLALRLNFGIFPGGKIPGVIIFPEV